MNLLPVDLDVGHVVFEDSWHVDLWELVLTEDYEKAGLTAGTVTYYDQFLANCSHLKQ